MFCRQRRLYRCQSIFLCHNSVCLFSISNVFSRFRTFWSLIGFTHISIASVHIFICFYDFHLMMIILMNILWWWWWWFVTIKVEDIYCIQKNKMMIAVCLHLSDVMYVWKFHFFLGFNSEKKSIYLVVNRKKLNWYELFLG